MRCPICLKEFTKVQEILYYSEPVYYCPYCNPRISDVRDNDQKAKTIKSKGLESDKVSYFAVNPQEETGEKIIGSSKSMQEVYKLIGQIATADIPVLITGESGTGKELVAKALHLYSNRKDKNL